MHSFLTGLSARDASLYIYRRYLRGGARGQCFSADTEREFADFLRVTQGGNLPLCILLGLGLWLVFALLDSVCYVCSGFDVEMSLAQDVLFARLVSFFALAGLYMGWRRGLWDTKQNTAYLVGVALYCCAGFVAGHFYSAMGAGYALAASALMLMVLFFPCGLRVGQTVPVASLLLGAHWFAAWWFLLPQQWLEFRDISALLTGSMVLMAFSSYLRERGAREQFLRLLDLEAGYDPLTGLVSYRSLMHYMEICLAQARRDGKTLLLVIVNLDHFNQYNEHYGGAAGDRALQQVALLLEHYAARPMDLAFRLGGAEFGLLSYADDGQGLKQRMQHFLDQLSGLQISHELSPTASYLTASIGIVQADAHSTLDSLFQQAADRLGHAKNSGRNQVYGPDTQESAVQT